jgi:6-phosphogluconolactonase
MIPRLVPVVLIALSLSLGCGTTQPKVCNLPATASTCTCGSCPAELQAEVYAAANDQIAVFPIQASSGALGSPTSSAGPAASPGMAVIQNAYLYASNPQAGSGGSIDAWTINTITGALTAVPGSPFFIAGVSVPAGLVAAGNVGPGGPFLYVADAGKIDALQLLDNGTGSLTAVPGSPFTSGTNLYLTVDPANHFVFAADEDPPGSVLAFTINASTGELTAVPGSPFAISSSGSAMQLGQITVDPTGSFVYVTIPSTSQIAAFSIAPSSGVLTLASGSPFAAGSGVFAITTFNNSPNNDFLYVSNKTAGTVSGYSINPTTGALSPLAGSPFPIDAAILATDISGGHLYATGASDMMVFSINPSTGALTQIGSPISFPGATALAYAGP